jgi:hypothetical protein
MGLIHQRGRAAGSREGDQEQASAKRKSGGKIQRALEHLAITDRASGAAVLAPGRRASDLRPAQLIGSGGNGVISPAGSAMEQGLHQAATGGAEEMGGNQLGGPGEITATTSNDHELTTTWQKDRGKQRRIRQCQCGGLSEQKHGKKMSAEGFLFKGSSYRGGDPLITSLLYQYGRTMRQVRRDLRGSLLESLRL